MSRVHLLRPARDPFQRLLVTVSPLASRCQRERQIIGLRHGGGSVHRISRRQRPLQSGHAAILVTRVINARDPGTVKHSVDLMKQSPQPGEIAHERRLQPRGLRAGLVTLTHQGRVDVIVLDQPAAEMPRPTRPRVIDLSAEQRLNVKDVGLVTPQQYPFPTPLAANYVLLCLRTGLVTLSPRLVTIPDSPLHAL